jgi:hypothetical protein
MGRFIRLVAAASLPSGTAVRKFPACQRHRTEEAPGTDPRVAAGREFLNPITVKPLQFDL